jgi:hypothetical protein
LEHIPDDTKPCRNCVLKPGGMAHFTNSARFKRALQMIVLPTRKKRAKIFGQYDHVRIYGRDYFDKLRSFTVVKRITRTKSLLNSRKYCLAKEKSYQFVLNNYCKKYIHKIPQISTNLSVLICGIY